MKQTRAHSMIEALANTGVGVILSLAAVQWIFPLFGVRMTLTENFMSTGIMTVISILRSYWLRRVFEWLHWRNK